MVAARDCGMLAAVGCPSYRRIARPPSSMTTGHEFAYDLPGERDPLIVSMKEDP
jgi:hypothetical protein